VNQPKPGSRRALLAERAAQILDILEDAHPEATCALHHGDAFQLTAATILSAQCTDERVNMVTPRLFASYPDARALARARPDDVEEIIRSTGFFRSKIRSTGFFRSKARSLIGCAQALVERHGGDVPRTMEEMVELPGVGRKTGSVVLGHAYDISEGIAVDTHVFRVSQRLGLARADDPLEVESQLMRIIPRERWTRTSDLVIFHGRKICFARNPACGACPVFALCRWPPRQAFAMGKPPRAKKPRRRGARIGDSARPRSRSAPPRRKRAA
jgi:endonuclease-3